MIFYTFILENVNGCQEAFVRNHFRKKFYGNNKKVIISILTIFFFFFHKVVSKLLQNNLLTIAYIRIHL